jgi:hypothetical protein
VSSFSLLCNTVSLRMSFCTLHPRGDMVGMSARVREVSE